MNAIELEDKLQYVDPVAAQTISAYPTEVEVHDAPPFRRFRMVRAMLRMPAKFVEMRYMTDGQRVLPRGTPAEIVKLVREEGLTIDESTVADYVKFFLSNTRQASFRIVEVSDDAGWLPGLEADPSFAGKRDLAEAIIHPVQAKRGPDAAFDVWLTAIDQRILFRVVLRVWPDGRVQGPDLKEILREVPVPYVRAL